MIQTGLGMAMAMAAPPLPERSLPTSNLKSMTSEIYFAMLPWPLYAYLRI